MMNKLTIRKIEGLESMNFAELSSIMIKKAESAKIDIANWEKEFPYKPECKFYIAHSYSHIVVLFQNKEQGIRAVNLEDNQSVWEDSCCEFFVSDPNNKNYYNFETSCIGTVLSAYGEKRENRQRRDAEQMSRIIRYSSLPHKLIEDKENSYKWDIAILIPLDMIGVDKDNPSKTLRANFYKCGDKTDRPHFLSWNAIDLSQPDFHRPEFFGELIWEY